MRTLFSALLLIAIAYAPETWADWPQFRGPDGQGHSSARGLPLDWSESENVNWKVPIPGTGWSSPVIAGHQIWITTAVEEGRSLRAVCVERNSGRTLHDIEVFRIERSGAIHGKNSYATPTPVLEDDRAYVHFGEYGTACLSTSGEMIWKTTSLEYHQPYAAASSPVLFGDRLILSCDGTDVQFLAALDKRTGTVVWKRMRQHLDAARDKAEKMAGSREGFALMAYSTPLVIDVGGAPQLVSPGADHVAAYNLESGEEIWWLEYDGFSLVARPVHGRGMVFVVGTQAHATEPILYAIRPDGRGDVAKSGIVWSLSQGVGHVPSPLLVGEELYLLSDLGIVTCLDAKTGRVQWKERIGGNYSASPIAADGRIYFFSENGEAVVLATGKQFKLLTRNRLDGRFMASPAVAGQALFLRTDTHLYRIESSAEEDPQ